MPGIGPALALPVLVWLLQVVQAAGTLAVAQVVELALVALVDRAWAAGEAQSCSLARSQPVLGGLLKSPPLAYPIAL